MDQPFDRGFIGFEANGDLMVAPVADADSLGKMGIAIGTRKNVGSLSAGQRQFLAFHRENVLLKSKFLG